MKLKLFLAAAITLLILGACTKEGVTTITPIAATTPVTPTGNTFKIGTSEFTSLFTFRLKPSGGDTALTGWDRVYTAGMNLNDINSWSISFKTFPSVNSTFRIVAYPSSGTLTSNTDAYITAHSSGSSSAWVSTGAGAVDVNVTFSGGKATIVVPSIPMMGTGGTTTTFSGTLKEM